MECKNTGCWKAVRSIWVLAALVTSAGCAGRAVKNKESTADADPRVAELRAQLDALQSKVAGVEVRLAAVNDKVDATRTSFETLQKGESASSETQEIKLPAVDRAELPTVTPIAPVMKTSSDPESGFLTDSAVQSYRKAMVLFDAAKYSEAILGFAQFLEQSADHPWAGSAQYHIGLCYVAQKEHKLAAAEFQRVLTSYDRSPHVADALLELSKCEEVLSLKDEAAAHRQQLLSLFPGSPAASRLRASHPSKSVTPMEPAEPAMPATAPVPQEKRRS
jgi:TolA-binding protein